MDREKLRESWRKSSAKYSKKPIRKEVVKRYNRSPAARACAARYMATEAGQIMERLAKRNPEYLLQRRLYMQAYRERV